MNVVRLILNPNVDGPLRTGMTEKLPPPSPLFPACFGGLN